MRRRLVGLVISAALISGCGHHGAALRAPPPFAQAEWVRYLVLHGAHHVDRGDLSRHLVTQASPKWPPWARHKPFDRFVLALDVRRIEDYYRAHGYFDATVRAVDVNPADKPNAVNVEIFIDEGAATKIRNFTVAGLDVIGDDARGVIRNVDLRRGQIFVHGHYLDEKGELRQRLRTFGYAWADVDGDVVVDRERHVADVTLKTTPGPLATIHAIALQGASGLNPRLIIRHSLLRPGQHPTPDALDEARARLYNLGFFSTVDITYAPAPPDPAGADVTIAVTQTPRNEWRLGAGFMLELQRSELRGSVEYVRHYFLGGLRQLRLRAEPGYVFVPAFYQPIEQGPAVTVEGQLTQLDLGLPPDELRLDGAYDLGVDYAYQFHGPRAALGYGRDFFHGHLRIGVAYDFQYLRFFNIDPAFTVDPALAAQELGFINPYRVAWLAQEVVLDLRDRPIEALRGGWFSVRAEEGATFFGGNFDYQKLIIEARGYYTLWRRLTVAARTEFGQIWTQGGLGAPTTRRFYLGGPDTQRGFGYGRLSPQIPSQVAGEHALPMGGDEMFLTQIELRVRAVRVWKAWLEVAAFVDAGDVAQPFGKFDHVDLSQLNVAVGGGLRYKTVLGTIRADIAGRVNRLTDFQPDGRPNPDPHQPVAFQLSIGEPF
jgi:outer membrane protein assembly factor BamA